MKLVKIVTLHGTMEAKSGISVGAGASGVHMGGADSEVIKHPLSGEPYIPGSSLKGRMRSMLEKVSGKVGDRGEPCGCDNKDCIVCTLFGAHNSTRGVCGQRRMYVHDININKKFIEAHPNSVDWTEIKASTAINRNSGTAARGSLRKIERISAGTTMDYTISIEVFEGDNEKLFKTTVEKALGMIESTGIGAATSTGSGQVDFHIKDTKWEEKAV